MTNLKILYFTIAYYTCLCASPSICIAEVDISWDFNNNNYDGWGNSTSEKSGIELRLENGELRGTIQAWNPFIDSSLFLLKTGTRHYVTIRLGYYGEATNANLLLRYGPNEMTREYGIPNWNNVLPSKAIAASSSLDSTLSFSAATDSDFYSSWKSNSRIGQWILIDLLTSRWITGLEIQSSGDGNSPKRCLLQQSMAASGIGPFETVASFVLEDKSSEQIIRGFEGHGRYWRLYIIDNYGGDAVQIREISLNGYDDVISVVPFNVDNTGKYKNYYLPIHDYASGPLIQMRLQLLHSLRPIQPPRNTRPITREGLYIDYVRIVRAPEVWRVRGCLERYFSNATLSDETFNVTNNVTFINNELPLYWFVKNKMSLQYATTYDCPLDGDVNITIDGINFGSSPLVTVNGRACPVLSMAAAEEGGRVQSLVCRLPTGNSGLSIVRVQNGILPGIFQEVPFLSYRTAPPVPLVPIITNIASCKIDLVWSPPGDMFDNMAVTGYKVLWFRPQFRSRVNNMTIGNVTTTSVRGLRPGTEYVFAIAAMSEGAFHEQAALLPTDLYGRRDASINAFIGGFSTYTNITATLQYDFNFTFFNANTTLNSSSATLSLSNGPTGIFGGEGQYGLTVVGSAHVENCNMSFTCCDGYNASIGIKSCRSGQSVCAFIFERLLQKPYVIDGISRNVIYSNEGYGEGTQPQIVVLSLDELISIKGAALPTQPCGPTLRLTPSKARQAGAVWYRRKQNVREGFDTTLTFHISNPSLICDRQNDVNTHCRSRGADGLAFVLQNVSPLSLGSAGKGLGYEGILNSLVVEIDTYFNYDQLDFYENHISVLTKGWRNNVSANHTYSLATTTRIPDVTDREHTLRIRYEPVFNEEDALHPSFLTNEYASYFLSNADYKNGGVGDWGVGLGMLYVYLDDTYSPVITTPLNLGATLSLDSGRCFVGVTAATGDKHWQVHDLLNWTFQSLFQDEQYTAPLTVNGEGAYECVNVTECVHRLDYNHYTRLPNLWGAGHDDSEDWQDGTEGFCSPCH